MAAAAAIESAIRQVGGVVGSDGSLGFPPLMLTEALSMNFGVLSVDDKNMITYYLLPLSKAESQCNAWTKDLKFAEDVHRGLRMVRAGTSYAIVLSAIVDGDACTKLCVFPRDRPFVHAGEAV